MTATIEEIKADFQAVIAAASNFTRGIRPEFFGPFAPRRRPSQPKVYHRMRRSKWKFLARMTQPRRERRTESFGWMQQMRWFVDGMNLGGDDGPKAR